MGSALTDDRTPSFQRLNPDHHPACTAEGGTVRAILDTPTVMSVFKGSGREIPSAVMFRLPSVMQAGAVEGGN